MSDGTTQGANGWTPEQVDAKARREKVAKTLEPFLTEAKIDREGLRDRMQRVAILQLMASVEDGHQQNVRENMKVLADLSGMKSTKIEITKGHTTEELDAFRLAGKARTEEIPVLEAVPDDQLPL